MESEVSVIGEEAFSSPKVRQLPPGTQISHMQTQQQQRLPQYREGRWKLSGALQGGPSGRGQPFVDIEIRVVLQ